MGNAVDIQGGITPPSKAAISFLRTKIWRIRLQAVYQIRQSGARSPRINDGEQIGLVLFRHDSQSGEKKLIVDGKLLHRSKDLLDGGDVIRFSLGGRPCRLEVVQFPGLTDYILYFDDIRIKSIIEEEEEEEDPDSRLKIRIPRAHIVSPTQQNPVPEGRTVLFEVLVQRGAYEAYTAERRFSEFDTLDCLVRSAYRGHHLESSLPPLPSKQVRLLRDHFSPEFVQGRRSALETYIRRLANIPHMVRNPDFLEFIGIHV